MTITVTLTDAMQAFIDQEVRNGGYATPSDYFAEMVRQRQRERVEEKLDALIREGMESGPAIKATPEFWATFIARLGESQQRPQ